MRTVTPFVRLSRQAQALKATLTDTVAAFATLASVGVDCAIPHPQVPGGEDRRALVLAQCLPPLIGGGVYRPTSWLRYAAQNAWKASAVGLYDPKQESEAGQKLLQTVPPQTPIYRYRKSALQPSWRLFPRVDGGFVNAFAMYKTAVHQRPPDERLTLVVASGPPFYVFVTGYFVARYYRIPLVLDYRDEWTECPFEFVNGNGADRTWEARCQSAAAAIVFTTRSQLQHQLATFKTLDAARCHIVPNGFDAEQQRRALRNAADAVGRLDRFTVSFFGALDDHCSPASFLSCLESALKEGYQPDTNEIILHFVGTRSKKVEIELARFSRQDLLRIEDQVPLSNAQEMMRRSDALLLLALPGLNRYLPGKLYEYIAARRPILVYGHEGEASRLVQELDAGLFVAEGDKQGLALAFHMIANRKAVQSTNDNVDKWLKRHTREATAANFFQILSNTASADLRPPNWAVFG